MKLVQYLGSLIRIATRYSINNDVAIASRSLSMETTGRPMTLREFLRFVIRASARTRDLGL